MGDIAQFGGNGMTPNWADIWTGNSISAAIRGYAITFSLTPSQITARGARLTIGGHTGAW